MQDSYTKHRETIFITILVVLLIAIVLISKFAFGINLGLLADSYQSVGYEEIREDGVWALSFGSFNGTVINTIPVMSGDPIKLIIKDDSKSGELTLAIENGEYNESFTLNGKLLEIEVPAESGEMELTLKGNDALYGYFNAIWE